MSRFSLVCAILMLCLFWADAPLQGSRVRLHVVVTNSVLEDLVRNVTREGVSLSTLVGPDGDPHTYEPTPKDNVAIQQADLIFENGLHLEPWLDDLYRSAGSHALRVKLADGIDLINSGEGRDDVDPHIWHDVSNVRIMVGIIRDSLSSTDPERAGEYHKNAEVLDRELQGLDHWVQEKIAELPALKRKLVTSHDTFGYFARRYGFQVIGTVISSSTTEAADPSASQMAKLVQIIKAARVRSIFVENVANPQMVRTIAQEAGVKVAPGLYSDALGVPGGKADTYIKMMKYNVATIVEALKDE